jgi:WD40-like Beta Propeller Repeat
MSRRRLAGLILSLLYAGGFVACSEQAPLAPEPVDPADGLRLEALTETALTGTVGMEVTPVPSLRVVTQDGSPAPGIEIRFHVSGGGAVAIASARTDTGGMATAGIWTLGPATGAHILTAHAAGLVDVVFTAMAEPGPVAKITQVSGNDQTGLAGDALSTPLRVRVADRFGNPVPGAPVTFVVISGDGTIDGTAAVADSLGMATSGAWTLGAQPGAQQVSAKANGAQVVFTAFACGDACRGQQLLFVRNDQIYALIDGIALPLTGGGRLEAAPAWSPDGRRIAFVRHDQDLTGDIYLMDADGHNVVSRAGGFRSPAWSPDGRLLAVHRGYCVYECDIYLLSVDEDGSPPVRIATYAAHPAWSPDGTKIAFVSLSGDDGYHALHVMNPDGTAVTAITLRDEGGISRPTWSPDGRQIAFAKCINGRCNIFAVNADGSTAVQLTTVPRESAALEPTWSPDGARIAFTLRSGPGLTRSSIVYIAADGGGEPIPMTSPGHSPAWRP